MANFAIIDVDNILIDEARTPLIISGSSNDNPRKYPVTDRTRMLQKTSISRSIEGSLRQFDR
ncbi:MAG: hypothetical protein U0894_07080 [Pirellulales bacterium]